MGDRGDEEEELQMALRMSLHGSPPAQPEPKRSKPPSPAGESPEAEARRKQRELVAAAAEKRRRSVASSPAPVVLPPPAVAAAAEQNSAPEDAKADVKAEPEPTTAVPMEEVQEPEPTVVPMAAEVEVEVEVEEEGEELPPDVAEKLWVMVFGIGVSKAVLAQWSNQGIRSDFFRRFSYVRMFISGRRLKVSWSGYGLENSKSGTIHG
jgi:hypothetical protein